MNDHPVLEVVRLCDRAISAGNYDALMKHYAADASLVVKPGMTVTGRVAIRRAFEAIANYFQHQLVVEQGRMEVIEGAGTALVIMETVLRYPDGQEQSVESTRRATYVFRLESDNQWRCTVDNSYGTLLLDPVLSEQG